MSKNKIGPQHRNAKITGIIDEENRVFEISFSSEARIMRFGWFENFIEILDHNPESVRMERINSHSAPFLVAHDRKTQIGIVENGEIDGSEKRGKARIRLSKTKAARDYWQDIKDGIRNTVSVGYRIYKAVLEEENEDGPNAWRIMDWEPVEISLEPTPSDISVGVGRSESADLNDFEIVNPQRNLPMSVKKEEKKPATPPQVDVTEIETSAARKAEKRFTEMMEIGEKFGMISEAQQAFRTGKTVEQFRGMVLEKLEEKKHINTQQAGLGLSEKDINNYSFQRVIQAQIPGSRIEAGYELELSREIGKRLGSEPQGIFVPHEIMVRSNKALHGLFHEMQTRDVTSGAGSGADLIGTDHLAGSFIELLRNKSIITNLGATVLSGLVGDISIPKQTGAATAYWVAEGGDATESQPTFGSLTMTPKFVTGFVQFTRKMLLQSNPSIEALVLNDLLRVIALAVDAQAISGDGTGNTPVGLLNTSGIGAVTGTSLDWEKVVGFETDVAEANADDLGSMAYLTRPTVNGILKTREKAANTAMYLVNNGQMNGYPVAVSNQVPAATLIFGVFSQIIVGYWGALDVLVDPFTLAKSGGIGVHAYQAADLGIRQGAAFSAANGDIT